MRADRAELSWDNKKSQWLVRIMIGEEVIRRHIKAEKEAFKPTLESLVVRMASDDGYELDPAKVSVTVP